MVPRIVGCPWAIRAAVAAQRLRATDRGASSCFCRSATGWRLFISTISIRENAAQETRNQRLGVNLPKVLDVFARAAPPSRSAMLQLRAPYTAILAGVYVLADAACLPAIQGLGRPTPSFGTTALAI